MIVQLSPERHSIIRSATTSEYSISLQRNCTTLERINLSDSWPILSAPVLSRLIWIPSPAGILNTWPDIFVFNHRRGEITPGG